MTIVANVSVGVVLLVDASVTVAAKISVGSVVQGVNKLPQVAVVADFDKISWSALIIDCCSCSENTSACFILSSIALSSSLFHCLMISTFLACHSDSFHCSSLSSASSPVVALASSS